MKKVTIQEIAKELGMSRNTVSKALANSTTVAEDTRYIVMKKAYEMGYAKFRVAVPKEIHEACQRSASRTIMVLGRREVSPFWNNIIMGISEEFNRNNCRLQLNFVEPSDEKNCVIPSELSSSGIHGIIMLSVMNPAYVRKIAACRIPMVFLDAPPHTDEFSQYGDVVMVEGANSVRKLMEHLIAQGMRRMAFIGDITYCRTILDRFRGYVTALQEAGLEMDRSIVFTEHVPERYYAREEVEDAINRMPFIPDAIVCANDDIAKDVYFVLKEKNIIIPRDVAVIGFDDKEEAEIMSPSLTTVHTPNTNIGVRLVQQLLWRMDNPERPMETIYVNTRLVLRESSVRSRIS